MASLAIAEQTCFCKHMPYNTVQDMLDGIAIEKYLETAMTMCGQLAVA
jgi:hypothetical protein